MFFIVKYLPIVAGSIGSLSVFQQSYKIWKTTNTRDISLISYFLLFLSAVTWIIYGSLMKEINIIIGSSIIILPSVYIVIYKISNMVLLKENRCNANVEELI